MSRPADRILFVGIGSAHGDDQIGWRIADALAMNPSVEMTTQKAAVPSDLLNWLDHVELLALCDACRGAGEHGALTKFEWQSNVNEADPTVIPELDRMRGAGSHSVGIDSVLDLALRLGRLPPRVIAWAVEGRSFARGEGISSVLEERLPLITETIRSDLCHA